MHSASHDPLLSSSLFGEDHIGLDPIGDDDDLNSLLTGLESHLIVDVSESDATTHGMRERKIG